MKFKKGDTSIMTMSHLPGYNASNYGGESEPIPRNSTPSGARSANQRIQPPGKQVSIFYFILMYFILRKNLKSSFYR